MKTELAEPADAPVPPRGTEQAVEEQQGQKPKTDATSACCPTSPMSAKSLSMLSP
jgi:hypothetical protein